ncbi:hypothetical protein AAG906_038831 [Vitis piasezkii]
MLLALHDLVHLEMLICSHKSSYLGFKKFREKGKDFNAKRYFFLQLGLHQDQQRPPASGTYTSLCLSTVATPFD